MRFRNILFEKEDHIVKITLHIPERRNPLHLDMRAELIEALSRVSADDSAKVVVITGAGKAFSSGGDITTMAGETSISARLRLKKAQRVIKSMIELEKPIIGAINGVAAGAGVSLALACDILIASEEAKFAMSFVKIGLIPDMGSYYLVPLRVGVARAKELMFTGDMIDAREAERIGLVNKVVSPEKLEEEVSSLASRLANGPSQAYAMIKAALNRWPASLESFFEMESSMQAVAFSSEDFDEGRRAFLEKRKPLFRGR
jgi:2-(1,2-epoxy-1,2-dihydrophenyl)acetyl-CoA isomerase